MRGFTARALVIVTAVTYATPEFEPYAELLAATARQAGVDHTRVLNPGSLPARFISAHSEVLAEPRGAGLWLWKPWAVLSTLEEVPDGSIVVWIDAAAHFAGPTSLLTSLMESHDVDLWIMGEGFTEGSFTKRDALVALGLDTDETRRSAQRFASCFAVRRTEFGISFAREYLEACCDRAVISDDPNTCGLANYPEFIDHRHDQSVFSLLSKRHGVPVVPNELVVEGLQPPRGQLVNHTRRHHSSNEVLRHVLVHGLAPIESLRPLAK